MKIQEIDIVIDLLCSGNALPVKYRDHSLTGEYSGYRECHIRPDLLLIYKIEKKQIVLVLVDIGSHPQFF